MKTTKNIIIISCLLATVVNTQAYTVQDDDGFVVNSITYSPALPGPGLAGKSVCNGFSTKTTTFKANCGACGWWNTYFNSCDCDLTRTKNDDVKTVSLQWKDTSSYVEVTVGATAPAGGVVVTINGKAYWKVESGYCTIANA